ncbi:5'-nucleotidase [Porphyromonas sp.]|uniref:5'-nucleotidase n=1 Tax=Porphyromonas sp. TaxID=1924944 RepID=UPI0026DC9A95|nr:5'-nucleotidase [Porphyromonas sp.]MDO4770600.1 5'-nucleotidase [Porphyromonas sp.]
MPHPIEDKLVIAVSSSALFNMLDSDSIFQAKGEDEYRKYQTKYIDKPFEKGVAFPFIKRLLSLNNSFPDEQPVEVVLFSKNSPETGLRAFRSIQHYGLNISRACFSSGKSNYQYLPAFNSALFLSANMDDVKDAIRMGYAAGMVLNSEVIDEEDDDELRLAFDFDGVIADDSSEKVYKDGGLDNYMSHEKELATLPLAQGPIGTLLKRISAFQKLEKSKADADKSYRRILKTAIVTARNAPAHERMVTTLRSLDVEVDEVFFLGGIDKSRILNILNPHIFFDDQRVHLDRLRRIPAVHIPFGITNDNK